MINAVNIYLKTCMVVTENSPKIITGKNEYLNKFEENQVQYFYSYSTFNFKFVSE